jgi:hypothetical protein
MRLLQTANGAWAVDWTVDGKTHRVFFPSLTAALLTFPSAR